MHDPTFERQLAVENEKLRAELKTQTKRADDWRTIAAEWQEKALRYKDAEKEGRLYVKPRCCENCEHWMEKYRKCDHPECPQDRSDDYLSPPDYVCELWELFEAARKNIKEHENEI